MLTPRGWWFFAFLLTWLFVGVTLGVGSLVLICLPLLFWFLATWLAFSWQTRAAPSGLRVQRTLSTSGGPANVLWARQPAVMHVELSTTGATFPYVLAVDRIPSLMQWSLGDPWARGRLSTRETLAFEYHFLCNAAGKLCFEGVKVTITDLQGFFHRTAFARSRVQYRVLPPLVEGPHQVPQKKRFNLIPLLGTHRLLRPGSGSELLDLRDYVPSDPPKLIAWKPSARRDKLITKELESEVPLRCTLFVDASSSVRVGPIGNNALARLVEIAAAVLYANSERRDLTGLCLVDEDGVREVLRPGRGRREFYERLHLLSEVADLAPADGPRQLDRLVPMALGLTQDLYPDWLHREVNHTPWWALRFWSQANRWRKRVAAVVANYYDLGPGGVSLLYYDDAICNRYVRRFLSEHRVPLPTLLYDDAGRYQFLCPEKIGHFARAILNAVARGKDNELFIVLVDLTDLEGRLEPLVRALKVALARHHQVQVVSPWPPGVPLPEGREASPLAFVPDVQELLSRVWTHRLHQSYFAVRRELGRIGVPLVPAPCDEAIPRILQRLQRLRTGATR